MNRAKDSSSVKLKTGKNGQIDGAVIKYKTENGKTLTINFGWEERNRTSGSYFDLDEYYLKLDVKARGLFRQKELYSGEQKVGESTWEAGRGGGGFGVNSLVECMKKEDLFAKFDAASPLKPFLERARQDTAAAIEEQHQQRELQNQGNNHKMSYDAIKDILTKHR